MLYAVLRQFWNVPNGSDWYTLHNCERDRDTFVREHMNDNGLVPREKPEIVFVDRNVYEVICYSKNGIWSCGPEYPVIKV